MKFDSMAGHNVLKKNLHLKNLADAKLQVICEIFMQ